MEAKDRVDDRTFKVDFSSEGAEKLREQVMDKLKVFMGDYTDDTLVEYIIVLLRNGRSRNEAKAELDVFLGDDSESFVAWLWVHLASSLDQYVNSRNSCLDGEGKTKSMLGERAGRNVSHHPKSDSERGKSNKISRSRHNREWKGLLNDAVEVPPLGSSDIDNAPKEGKNLQPYFDETRRSVSPEHPVQRKRCCPDTQVRPKENISAPRRLLQFAVRDAVANTRPSISSSEPSLKRLRSVVSTSNDDSPDVPHRIHSIATVPNATTAIRAVAKAAEDVRKARPGGNVFDRLSCVDPLQSTDQTPRFKEPIKHNDYEIYNQIYNDVPQVNFQGSNFNELFLRKSSMIEGNTGLTLYSISDNEKYDDDNVVGCRIRDLTHSGSPDGKLGHDSMMMHFGAQGSHIVPQEHKRDPVQHVSVANSSHRIASNVSTHVNPWKSSHHQSVRKVAESQKSAPQAEVGTFKSNVSFMKENSKQLAVNRNGNHAADLENEVQISAASTLGSYSTVRPLEDVDSRTIFLSNVHFAATKDSLARHFNKFGEVLKVIILIDPATGQPKGSAYLEFMRKESADSALSLDGTSFMSRLLKVVTKSSAQQEASPIMTWPRIVRGSPFAVSRFGWVPFPRILPGACRGRPGIKTGARSMQWKRDAQASLSESGAAASSTSNFVPCQPGRGLTYVRTEAKAGGNPETS